jgi:hypothetical protein
MRKLVSAGVVCALAIGLVAVPGALAKKGPKLVGGAVSVNVTPTTFTTGDTTVTTASVNGNVASNSNCRKFRTVRFEWVDAATNLVVPPAIATTSPTGPNGDYSAVVPRPSVTNPPTTSVYLRAIVDPATRKVGSKKKRKTKKGRVFNCQQITGQSAPVSILPAPTI